MSAPLRRRSGPPAQEAAHVTVVADSTRLHRPEDGYATPTAEDRREALLLAEVRALGYGLSVRCRVCRHPLTAAKSVAAHVGPKCAARVVAG